MPKNKKQVDSLFQATHTSDDISVDAEDKRPPRSGNCGFIMRRLSTWHIAAFCTPIVTLFIVGACSQQPSSTPAVEPVATPTSAPGDAGDESGNQVAGQTSQDQSTQEEGQTTDTSDSTATATQEDIEAIINGILAVLLNDAMMDLRDLEEEVEAEIALLADDEQALVGAGE